MRRCRENLPNRCCHLTSRVARRAFEGVQAANLRNLGSVPSRWLGGSVVRWLGSCANPQPETHASRPENEGLVPKVPILKYRIIHKGQANIMQIACAVAGSVPRFSTSLHFAQSALRNATASTKSTMNTILAKMRKASIFRRVSTVISSGQR